jgi:hypothetical protein
MINFDGMIALAMGDPARVSAGILDAHHHTPRMVINRVNGNGDSEVIATLEAKQMKGGLSIDLQAATRRGEKCKVDKYHCANGVRGDENDLRWGIDFNSDLYPQAGPLRILEDRLWGKLHISAGTWFTSKLSEFKWRFVSADKERPSVALNFERQVGAISNWIDMDEGDELRIRGESIDLRLNVENGYGYRMDCSNLPMDASMAAIDHFLYYFDIIEQELPKYVPVMAARAAFGPYPALCDPAIFSK